MRNLAMEVVERDGVLVDDAEVANAGSGEEQGARAAEATGTDDQRRSIAEALLCCSGCAASAMLRCGLGLIFDVYGSGGSAARMLLFFMCGCVGLHVLPTGVS
jgi:hypothetical protein